MIYILFRDDPRGNVALCSLLEGPDGQNLDELFERFRTEVAAGGGGRFTGAALRLAAEHLGLAPQARYRPSEPTPVFVAWLVQRWGFRIVSYIPVVLDFSEGHP